MKKKTLMMFIVFNSDSFGLLLTQNKTKANSFFLCNVQGYMYVWDKTFIFDWGFDLVENPT